MAGGAPVGNTNAAKGKRWQRALERALARKYDDVDEGLAAIAATVVKAAAEGDKDAWKEIGDRMDGRARQQIEATGPEGGPLVITWLTAQASE